MDSFYLPMTDEQQRALACDLPNEWRATGRQLRAFGAAGQAAALETAALQLEQWLSDQTDELWTIGSAAQRVGRSRSAIERALRNNRLANHGRKHKPLVRAGDVTRLFPTASIARREKLQYDVNADARSILDQRGDG